MPRGLGGGVATLLTVALHPQVFWPGQTRPVFYVASRGHHADIGGITPGSMPPHSTTLQQEGAVFLSFKLVQGGVFQEEGEQKGSGAGGWHTCCCLQPGRVGCWNSAHHLRPASGEPGGDISQQ